MPVVQQSLQVKALIKMGCKTDIVDKQHRVAATLADQIEVGDSSYTSRGRVLDLLR